jgi:hypothetical protein
MVEEIKEILENKDKKYFVINCRFCKKEIKGTSKSQIESLLLSHKINKHRDKIEIKEKK